MLTNGVDRNALLGDWKAFRNEVEGYPAPKANPWDGQPEHEDRIVRWVFLESDAELVAQYLERN